MLFRYTRRRRSQSARYNAHIHFFHFRMTFQPRSDSIDHTTHTSSYTFWFLKYFAEILARCFQSSIHAYMLKSITSKLGELDTQEPSHYLFFTSSIYASTISTSESHRKITWLDDLLRSLDDYRNKFPTDPKSPLGIALRFGEVEWPLSSSTPVNANPS